MSRRFDSKPHLVQDSRPAPADMRGGRRPSALLEEAGSWGKHSFPHEASASEARDAS